MSTNMTPMPKSCQGVWDSDWTNTKLFTYFFSEFHKNTKHLMPWKNPPAFRLPPIQKQLKMVPFSDIIALRAYQLGVGYATNLGCCEAPESGHDCGSYQNPAINGVFSMVAFGRTDVKIPHLTSAANLARVFRPIFRFWVSGKFPISSTSAVSLRNVATAEQVKDYEWLPNTYLFFVQRLFQDRAVIRQRWLLEDRVRSLTC